MPGSASEGGTIPDLLRELGEGLSKILNFPYLFNTEASIINYYPSNNATIGIHRDDAGTIECN